MVYLSGMESKILLPGVQAGREESEEGSGVNILWTLESAEVAKPYVVHFACRRDDGSLLPRFREVRGVDGYLTVEFPGVQELYCRSCQFTFGRPGCLVCDEEPIRREDEDDGEER